MNIFLESNDHILEALFSKDSCFPIWKQSYLCWVLTMNVSRDCAYLSSWDILKKYFGTCLIYLSWLWTKPVIIIIITPISHSPIPSSSVNSQRHLRHGSIGQKRGPRHVGAHRSRDLGVPRRVVQSPEETVSLQRSTWRWCWWWRWWWSVPLDWSRQCMKYVQSLAQILRRSSSGQSGRLVDLIMMIMMMMIYI